MNYDTRINGDGSAAIETTTIVDPLEEVEEDRRDRRRLFIIAAVVLVLIVAVWFLTHRGGEPVDQAKTNQAPVVTVIQPGRTTVVGEISATGSLAARVDMPVGVPGEGGQVVSVLVQPGSWVRAGQALAVIDRTVQVQQQASQAAQIQSAQASLALAQANYDRAIKLLDRGFISKADIDRLRATRDQAAAQVRVAGAQLGVLRAQADRLNVVAPAAGLVLERRVEPGQVVGPGSGMLFRIAKGGEMEMKAALGQTDLAQISTGISADVVPVGSPKHFVGQVWQVAPVIDPASRQGFARIALAYAPELRPGGFASATIRAGSVVAPMLPESAILSDNKGSYVYIVGANNKVERRAVKTGTVSDTGIAVVEGLSGTEKVVLRAGGFLSPGETVQPRASK
ncbi:efflux RND transporter periplasmic adaptor subunit [Parablastomonas sp. CN1-191]|uniref:efflux RND transporter periplasmic adaptor subunit n=1 Tax=Parablastomonas sp. CN1-191 TaxID=3400908 RepID=UPI003BF85E8F